VNGVPECPHCGLEIAAEDSFCKHCGGKIASERARSQTMDALAREFQHAVDEHPNDADAQYSLALSLFYNEHWAKAEAHLRRVIELTPGFADTYARLVVCLVRLGRAEEAVAAVKAGLAVAPENEDLLRLKGQLDELMSKHA
jgi:Flp pilus assembly protein TadD